MHHNVITMSNKQLAQHNGKFLLVYQIHQIRDFLNSKVVVVTLNKAVTPNKAVIRNKVVTLNSLQLVFLLNKVLDLTMIHQATLVILLNLDFLNLPTILTQVPDKEEKLIVMQLDILITITQLQLPILHNKIITTQEIHHNQDNQGNQDNLDNLDNLAKKKSLVLTVKEESEKCLKVKNN